MLLQRVKPLARILAEGGDEEHGLKRSLGPWALTAMGIHALDALIGLMGPARSAYAHSYAQVSDRPGIDDTTVALFRLKSGASMVLTTLAATTQNLRIQVYGSEGMAEIRGANQLVITPVTGQAETRDYPPFDMERAELEAGDRGARMRTGS